MKKNKRFREKSQLVEVRCSGIHRRGLFAQCDIRKDTRIIEYIGERITTTESTRRSHLQMERAKSTGAGSTYIFHLNSRYDIDGDVSGNDAKYINHSCDPNTVCEIIDHAVWIIALRDIEEGDEILYDYNFDASCYEDYPCCCGADQCLGYIVGREYRPALKKILSKKGKKKARASRDPHQ